MGLQVSLRLLAALVKKIRLRITRTRVRLICIAIYHEEFVTYSDPSPNPNKPSLLIPILIWAIFLSGLLLQFFSPHLRIDHDAFLMPPDSTGHGLPIDPQALVRRERMIQLLSAFLSVTGAVCLALYYRRTLLSYLPGKR